MELNISKLISTCIWQIRMFTTSTFVELQTTQKNNFKTSLAEPQNTDYDPF